MFTINSDKYKTFPFFILFRRNVDFTCKCTYAYFLTGELMSDKPSVIYLILGLHKDFNLISLTRVHISNIYGTTGCMFLKQKRSVEN